MTDTTAQTGYEALKSLAVKSQGQNPDWIELTDTNDKPYSSSAGKSCAGAVLTRVLCALRELPGRFSSRVTVTTVDDSATYTITIDGLTFAYAASGGDTAEDILAGLSVAIAAGESLGSLTLTFTDANPDTILRSAGSWITDGVAIGTQVYTDSVSNPGPFTVASLTATLLTLDAADVVVGEGPTAYTVTVKEQVTPTLEDRDKDSLSDTLVITRADNFLNEHITTIAATGTGVLAAEEDCSAGTMTIYTLPEVDGDDQDNLTPRQGMYVPWVRPRDASETLDSDGFDERVFTSGSWRVACYVYDLVGPSDPDAVTPTAHTFIGPSLTQRT